MSHRVGIGFDSHALVAGRPCVLGGVRIPHPAGPLGHSDGDAVLHALADALLGAAGLADLGTLYPDGDARWKDADSAHLLREVVAKVRAAGFQVENVDVVVATEGPRIAPHREAIRARIGEILGVERSAVNVKGKSLEGLPLTAGSGAFVAVHAVCLLTIPAR
jgi:2-C-methyl-D-erythritol 2,4-cyclodiphosphate synthase